MIGTIGHRGAKKKKTKTHTGHGPARTKKQRRTYRKRRDLRSPGQKVYSNPHNQLKEKTGAKPGKKRTPGPLRGGPKTRFVNQFAEKKTEGPSQERNSAMARRRKGTESGADTGRRRITARAFSRFRATAKACRNWSVSSIVANSLLSHLHFLVVALALCALYKNRAIPADGISVHSCHTSDENHVSRRNLHHETWPN